MSATFERNKGHLMKILPENYDYHVLAVSVRDTTENIPSEVKLEAHFRVNVSDEEEFEKFLSEFSQVSGTFYNKKNKMDRSGKKSVSYGVRKCIHNVLKRKDASKEDLNKNMNKTGKAREPGKNTNCPAELNFSLSSLCNSICGNKTTNTHQLRNNFPLEVKLCYIHNHTIASADAARYRPVSEETKEYFIKLFDDDVSPSSAYRRILDFYDDKVDDHTADRYHIPDYKWVFNFHAQYIKTKYGSSNGPDVFRVVKDNIQKFNSERGEELAKVKQTESGETIVAVCDKFNKRVHEYIPAAGDLLIMDGTANLDRNDTKVFHLMCPSPVGGLLLGTLIMTRADEETIAAALDLYKELLPEKAFYGRGKDLGPVLAITDDDSAERNALSISWPGIFLLLCVFHHLQALWTWLWKAEHGIEKEDRPDLINLVKKLVYAKTTEDYTRHVDEMKENEKYKKYQKFCSHVEEKILPRHREWSLKERYENKLPTHNQNTTNFVEYSFRMTKDIQFSRLKAYNLTDLVDICLDDSRLYTRRCVDVGHNRNYHLFTNQKSRYIFKDTDIDTLQIIQLTQTEYLVPSETIPDKLYRVDIGAGLCECMAGALKGPCKHKSIVANKFKMKNFEILPKHNAKMRAFYHFLGTGIEQDMRWFRPLVEEDEIPLVDWNEETTEDSEEEEDMSVENGLSIKETNMSISSSSKSESDENDKDDSDLLLLGSLKKSIFCLIYKIENRFGQEKLQFRKAISAFIKQCSLLSESNDARIQKALFTFAKDNVWKKERRRKMQGKYQLKTQQNREDF